MFKDKVYEELDDISKLVEPFECQLNNEILQLPDEIEIDIVEYCSQEGCHPRWGLPSIGASDVIRKKAKELNLKKVLASAYDVARDFYEFKVKMQEADDQIILNMTDKTISHKISLVKKKHCFDDAELANEAKRKIVFHIRQSLNSNRNVNKPRLNEIADLYGAYHVRKDRSYKGKVIKFCDHLLQLIDDRKLNIKDMALCGKFARWITLYVRDGNLAALNNITRLKIMMHENRPIYSIEEKEVK